MPATSLHSEFSSVIPWGGENCRTDHQTSYKQFQGRGLEKKEGWLLCEDEGSMPLALPSGMNYNIYDTCSLSLWGDSLISEISRCHITFWVNKFSVYFNYCFVYVHGRGIGWKERLWERGFLRKHSRAFCKSFWGVLMLPVWSKLRLLEVQSCNPAVQSAQREIKDWCIYCQVTLDYVHAALFPHEHQDICREASFYLLINHMI